METKASTEKGLLRTSELYKYIMDTSVYPREHECLKQLRTATSTDMSSAPDVGQFMALLLKAMNAKKTIEIGVFTGYSLLLTALNIPDDGQITAIDINRTTYEFGLPIFDKAGVKHKINFIEYEALMALDELLNHPKHKGAFDFAFVDADKANYAHYHERLLELLRPGGVVVYNNTLCGGTVAAASEGSIPESKRADRNALVEFNKRVAADNRVQISQVALGDGITICRRL